jgi:radical SAM superfamily enzyme
MPLDTQEIKGTEKDGTKSNEYCMYCYANGAYTDPDMTMEEMKVIIETQMKKMNLPDHLIELSVKMLPSLKRWSHQNA